ncbi:hypothetical protein TNCT_504511 [Trichonephila clavata]|uniref:EGF-like domain-containing protein n=1 Tax=Trichonephila clavata TaxID=2740835 RepID=A0A8X6HEE4_TRICU|nr:hypothetical protein TNCT_504511 [Trichonephila clavata]
MGDKLCSCQDGYVERNGQCTSCDCGIARVKCSFKGGTKICECPEGYRDHLGKCLDINECQENPCDDTAYLLKTTSEASRVSARKDTEGRIAAVRR